MEEDEEADSGARRELSWLALRVPELGRGHEVRLLSWQHRAERL